MHVYTLLLSKHGGKCSVLVVMLFMYEGPGTFDYCGRCGASVVLSGPRAKTLYHCYNCGLEYRLPHEDGEQKPHSKRRQPSASFQDTATSKQRKRKQEQRVKSEHPERYVKARPGVAMTAAFYNGSTEHIPAYKSSKPMSTVARPSVDRSSASQVQGRHAETTEDGFGQWQTIAGKTLPHK